MPGYEETAPAAPRASAGPWAPALALLIALTWSWKYRIVGCAILCAALVMTFRFLYPGNYSSTEQLLFDPDGLKIFASDVGNARLDANAEINFVESQMGVLLSEGVLNRVIVQQCRLFEAPSATGDAPPPASFHKLCPSGDADPSTQSAKAVDSLRKMLVVKRAERSFLVDVTATSTSPLFSAQLASAVVSAYREEDTSTRAAMANRLTTELNARLETLRKTLSETEAKAEKYRSDKHLLRVGDKLLIEQKLTDASAALSATEVQLERARARLKQLETTPRDATGLGALGDGDETRPLALMLERRAGAEADLAPLEGRLGARNPALVAARNRLTQAQRDIAAEIKSIRSAAKEQFSRAEHEHDSLSQIVGELSKELTRAREEQIALQGLEQSVEANRKLLDSLENRSRELAEMGRIDAGNLRIASRARPPEPRGMISSLVQWGAAGLIFGLFLTMSFIAFVAVWRTEVAGHSARVPVKQADAEEAYAADARDPAPADLAGGLVAELAHLSSRMRGGASLPEERYAVR